jgi:hypothetical protein
LLLIVLHHFALAYLMNCDILLSAHICSYMLGHAEPKLEETMKQAKVEEFTNLVWIKASPDTSNQCPCLFILNLCFMFYFDCALSL